LALSLGFIFWLLSFGFIFWIYLLPENQVCPARKKPGGGL
jgi:hypothetical protein